MFLEGTESELADFGNTGGDAFAAAWAAHPADPNDGADTDPFAGFEDKASRRSRDLDRRSSRWVVLLALFGVSLAGFGVAVQQGVFEDENQQVGSPLDQPNVIDSIGGIREYDDGPGEVALATVTGLDRAFIAPSADENPAPVSSLSSASDASSSETVEFGAVFWAGRAHIAIVGSDIDLDTECVVVSLVANDFRAVDLAAHGRCGSAYQATGDRLACAGSNLLLLEVWPFDPDSVVDQPDVTVVRVRVEAVDEETGAVESMRGMWVLDADLVDEAVTMLGRPGEVAQVTGISASGTCTLLDRDRVTVQLL